MGQQRLNICVSEQSEVRAHCATRVAPIPGDGGGGGILALEMGRGVPGPANFDS